MIDRKLILDDNAKVELVLHKMLSPNDAPAESDRDVVRVQLTDVTANHLKKLSKSQLTPFLKSRIYTSTKDKLIPSSLKVGKNNFSEALKKLEENAQYIPTKAEDSLLFRAFQIRTATDLTLKVEASPKSETTAVSVPHLLGRVDVHFNNHSFIDNKEL